MSYQAGLTTAKLYKSVIDEVINNCREAFLDEGIDEQVLQELKQIWETKVLATKSVDSLSDHPTSASQGSSSSGSHGRSHQASSHSATGNSAVSAAAANAAHTNSIVHPQPASVLVAAPSLAASLDAATAAAAAAGGFSHLAGPHIFQPGAGPAALAVSNFAFPPSVITGGGGGQVIMTPGMPTIRYMAAQLPTVPATQVNQNAAAQRRNLDGNRNGNLPQVDGPTGLSDDEDDFEDEDDAHETIDEPAEAGGVEEGEPLNSEDDVSNEDAEEMFDADNVVVCQYEKVTRTRNKWKFVLKDGVMNLDGKDYVFNRANGEAEF